MAGQVNTNSAAKAVVCKKERNMENSVGQLSKFCAKLTYNEDGTPTIIDGSYLFMKDNGATLSLNSNLIDVTIENQVVRVVADDNSVEEISLDCSNDDTLIALTPSNVDATPTTPATLGDSWGDAPTRLLIDLYGDLLTQVKSRELRTFKAMWERASELMAEQGYAFTACQISNRFKTLKRAYNKRRSDLGVRRVQKGRIRPFVRRCPFQRELDELFTKQAEMFPASVPRDDEGAMMRAQLLASAGFDPSAFLEGDDDDQTQSFADAYATPMVEIVDHMDYGEPSPPPSPPAGNPRRKTRPNPLEELRTLRANTLQRLTVMDKKRDSFHEEVLEELKHKNDMLEKLLELVTKESLS